MAKNRRRTRKKRTERSRRQVKQIDVLPDDVLLGIFDFYVSPSYGNAGIEAWQSLVHVCRRWRTLVFGSPRRLNLQLYCTPETPAEDTLGIWPALPLIVTGDMASSYTDNVIATLEQSDRICRVNLSLEYWQFEEVLAAMQVPFPELTDLWLSSVDEIEIDETLPVNPDSFLDGSFPFLDVYFPRLQDLSLSGLPFIGLPNLLLSATHLVNLSLFNIPHSGYISPEAMVALLSVLSSLKVLCLEFRSPPDQESPGRSLPPSKCSILPALDEFHFKGVTEYLEELVTRIDTPQLDKMHITLPHQIDFDCRRLAQFINRTPTLWARDKARVYFDNGSTSVALLAGSSTLEIGIPCRVPFQQLSLSSVARVCNSSLHPLSTVETLYIQHARFLVFWKERAFEKTLWLQLLLPFTAVKNLYLSTLFGPRIAAALQDLVGGRITEVLPSLQNIFVQGLEPLGPFQESIGQFVTARQLSGHPVAISDWDCKKSM